MALIALTRGSFIAAFKLAEKLSEGLGCAAVSREDIIRNAKKYGIEETGMAETGYMEINPPSFWDRHAAQRRLYLIFLKASLMEYLIQGGCIYHGHLGQFLLSDVPRLLRVRVDASPEYRIAALVREQGLTEADAKKNIEEMDSRRKNWAKFLYGVDFNDTLNYDMVLNLDKMNLDTMAEIITCATQRAQYSVDRETLKAVEDVYLKSVILAYLARSPRTRGIELALECDSETGRVTATGRSPVVGYETWEDDIREVISAVEGVSKIIIAN